MMQGKGEGKGAEGSKPYARQTLQPGENMAQLTEVRRTLEKELGSAACKRLRTPVLALDVLLVLAYPLLAWVLTYLVWTHPVDTLVYWAAAPLSGWCMLSCSLVYHDVCGHRAAFGKWGSWLVGLWVTSGSPMLMKEMNTTWMARHRIHHKHTFEAKDPELFRSTLASAPGRLACLLGMVRGFWRRRQYAAYNAHMDVAAEHGEVLGAEYAVKMAVEAWLVRGLSLGWAAAVANGGPANAWVNAHLLALPATTLPAARTLLAALSWFGVFDTVRWILEHGEQDMDNAFWQSTLYETGFWSRLACTWDSGDCHTVHHVWGDVPIYRMPEAVQLINPVMVARGVTLRTDFWQLVRAYLLHAEPHANPWKHIVAPEAAAGKKRN